MLSNSTGKGIDGSSLRLGFRKRRCQMLPKKQQVLFRTDMQYTHKEIGKERGKSRKVKSQEGQKSSSKPTLMASIDPQT